MKLTSLLSTLLALVILQPALAVAQQSARMTANDPTVTYRDPESGKLHTLIRAEPDTTLSPTTGTITVTLKVTLKSKWPTGAKPTYSCGLSGSASSMNLGNSTMIAYTEDVWEPLTMSGSSGTCTLTLPYSWVIPASSSLIINTLDLSYSINVVNNAGTLESTTLRMLSGIAINSAIPASGTTTTKSLSVVL